jgi:hypothetical protein
MITPNELRKRAIEFSREHAEDYDEKSQAQNFWRDFFAIWGLTPQRIGVFESRARTLKGTVGFIDFFWPGTLLVEHKSRGRDLDAAVKQALDYCITGGLKETEMPRFILVSDFEHLRLLELAPLPGTERIEVEFLLSELHEKLHLFNFILGYEQRTYADEDPVNIKAAELMGALHDALKAYGFEGHPLELYLVRLMFCFFADDTGIFPKDQFAFIMEEKTREDGSDIGLWVAQVFQTLNTASDKRMRNLDESLTALPYVNGGLFEEALPVPQFDKAMRTTFLHCCLFNWSAVSPAIFGSLFQSVMDAKARRNLGAHYTSEKNILKTIHGLFLDMLHAEFNKSKGSVPKLKGLLSKIRGIRILDPACGCGNFLILAYRELRLLEIAIHREIQRIEKQKYMDLSLYRGIDVEHMYGIEIEKFPAQIARTALWIMDHMMNVRLSEEFGEYIVNLPLTQSPHVVHGNALRLDWKEIVQPAALSYILGNPPFIGKKEQKKEQKDDLSLIFSDCGGTGVLDYVTCWYYKAAEFIQGTNIRCAFVSTNSITQGEQVGVLWEILFQQFKIKIDFGHRTFKWQNEAKGNAAVHCVIIGFGIGDAPKKYIHEYESPVADSQKIEVDNITPYLAKGSDIYLKKRSKPISSTAPEMMYGSMMIDDGHLIFTNEIYESGAVDPIAKKYSRLLVGGEEYINSGKRWCLWLVDADPMEIRISEFIMGKISKVREFRLASKRPATNKLASTPGLFGEIRQPKCDYLIVPKVSSEGRFYIPIGFLPPTTIASGSALIIPNASLFHFGILTSGMHMAWMRQVCGRMKSDYQYSSSVVYNNFPWPTIRENEPQMERLSVCAQAVLDCRLKYPGSSLADLYDPLTIPADLSKAHKALDAAVDKCYRKEAFRTELERVEFLFNLYERYSQGLFSGV